MQNNHYNSLYFNSPIASNKKNSQRNKNRLNEVLNHHSKGKLLEIGCGRGYFLMEAAKQFEIEGWDISDYAVSVGSEILKNKIRVVDVQIKEFPNSKYSVVAAFNVLEHLEDPESVIRKVYKSLRKGGLFIGSVPNNSKLIGRIATILMNISDSTHISTFSPEIWEKNFSESGFNSIELFGELNFGKNYSQYLKSITWQHYSFNMMFACIKK